MGQPSRPLSPSPKLIVPIAILLIFRPEDPRRVYSIKRSCDVLMIGRRLQTWRDQWSILAMLASECRSPAAGVRAFSRAS